MSTTFGAANALDMVTLDNLYQFEPMAARIVDREPDDMIREGFDLKGWPADVRKRIEKETKRLGVLKSLADARRWSRLYGGAGAVMLVDDGRGYDEPLDRKNIRAFRGLLVVDRYQMQVETWNLQPGSVGFGGPQTYTVSTDSNDLQGRIHADRVVRFNGIDLPHRIMMRNGGWGASVLDRVWAAIRAYGSSHEYIEEMLSSFSYDVVSIKGLADGLDSEAAAEVIARLEAMRAGLSIIGALALDADSGERYESKTRSVAGVDGLVERFVARLVAATDMPRSILLGETPGGLNSGENAGEIRSWYDAVRVRQRDLFVPALEQVLEVMLRSRLGPTAGLLPVEWGVDPRALWQQSELERAQTRAANAQARSLDVQSQIVDPNEARRDEALREDYRLDDDEVEIDVELDGFDDDREDDADAVPVESPHAPPPGEALKSPQELGDELGVSPASIRAMHRRKQINGWSIGGRWRFARSEVLEATHRPRPVAVA